MTRGWVASVMGFFLAGVAVSTSAQAFSPASAKAWDVKASGVTAIVERIDGVAVDLNIVTAPARFPPGGVYPVPPFGQCQYFPRPCSLTQAITLRGDGHRVDIPSGAFTDLADIHYASVGGSPSRIVVTLTGGDAADSYEVRLIFNRERLIERLLYAGEDDASPIQVCYYHLAAPMN